MTFVLIAGCVFCVLAVFTAVAMVATFRGGYLPGDWVLLTAEGLICAATICAGAGCFLSGGAR